MFTRYGVAKLVCVGLRGGRSEICTLIRTLLQRLDFAIGAETLIFVRYSVQSRQMNVR